MPQGKKYKAAVATYDVESFFEPQAALAKVKSMATAKFDETIDLAVRLGLDPRKADQAVRGDRKSTRLNSSHSQQSRMPSSA